MNTKKPSLGILLSGLLILTLVMSFANTGLASDQWINQGVYMSYLPLVLNTQTNHLLAFI